MSCCGNNSPSNMRNFTENSYNLTGNKNSWCVAPGSIYTNPSANFNYFTKTCGDPYTSYAYWYRRFPNEVKYNNCYFLPYVDPLLHNKYGYVKNYQKNCFQNVNMHWNEYDRGFKFYDTKINPTSVRVKLSNV
jgi:hypothetical protein